MVKCAFLARMRAKYVPNSLSGQFEGSQNRKRACVVKKNMWLKNRTFVEYILFYPFTTLVCDFILKDTLRGEKLEQSLPA